MTPRSGAWIAAGVTLAVGLLIAIFVMLAMPRLFGLGGPDGGTVKIGGPFQLTDQSGRTVTDKDLKGKPTLVFFGFTHCPEICPTTLYEITQVLDVLKDDAADVNAMFVSVDPERDSQEMLKTYLSSFHPRITGLTGTPEEIASIARSYRVYYKKVPLEGGDYTMDHTAVVYLFDKDGEFVAPLNVRQEPEKAAQKVRELL